MNDVATRIEPIPTPSEGPACWDVAIQRIGDHKYGGGYIAALVRFAAERDEFGAAKYKTRLRPNDGRSSLVDALQEGLDKLVYLVKAEMEDIDVSQLIEDEIRAMIRLAGVLDAHGILWDEASKRPHACANEIAPDDPAIDIAARAIRDIGPCAAFAELHRIYNMRTVPGPVVTASRLNRGLRVGMTYQEVRDNLWTQCEATQSDADGLPVGRCTEGDPCPACKFLDGALCTCGHPFSWHFPSNCGLCQSVGCSAFSLASWTPERDDPRPTLEEIKAIVDPGGLLDAPLHGANPSEGTQSNERNAMLEKTAPIREYVVSLIKELGAGGASIHLHVATPDLLRFAGSGEEGETCEKIRRHKAHVDANSSGAGAKKPRVNRATWHETDEGKDAILRVTGALSSEPVKSLYAREVANEISVGASDVSLALDHLLTTGAIVKHGKAKGTRYAVAGFTDWPAPLPRGKKQDDQVAEGGPPSVIGIHGAT